MKIEDIQQEWGKDSIIDPTNIVETQSNQNRLKAKYMDWRLKERMVQKILELENQKLRKQRAQYYLGRIPLDVLKVFGWEPYLPPHGERPPIKADIADLIEADQVVIDHTLKLAAAQEKVDYIEDVLRSLSSLNYMIKNIMDSKRFDAGEYRS